MKYRVIVDCKIHKFNTYGEALKFKLENGGDLYEQILF